MAIISFFTICFFLTAVGKNMEVLSCKYLRDQRSCTPWLKHECWHPIGHSLYENNFKVCNNDFKLLVRYDIATEKLRTITKGIVEK